MSNIKLKEKIVVAFCSKDETRPSLLYAYMDEKHKALISTDGHRLALMPSLYRENLAGKFILSSTVATGDYATPSNYMGAEFPNISTIIGGLPKELNDSIYFPEWFSKLKTVKRESPIVKIGQSFINGELIQLFAGNNLFYASKSEIAPIVFKFDQKDDDLIIIMPMKLADARSFIIVNKEEK